jgi:hypothetical protein
MASEVLTETLRAATNTMLDSLGKQILHALDLGFILNVQPALTNFPLAAFLTKELDGFLICFKEFGILVRSSSHIFVHVVDQKQKGDSQIGHSNAPFAEESTLSAMAGAESVIPCHGNPKSKNLLVPRAAVLTIGLPIQSRLRCYFK